MAYFDSEQNQGAGGDWILMIRLDGVAAVLPAAMAPAALAAAAPAAALSALPFCVKRHMAKCISFKRKFGHDLQTCVKYQVSRRNLHRHRIGAAAAAALSAVKIHSWTEAQRFWSMCAKMRANT